MSNWIRSFYEQNTLSPEAKERTRQGVLDFCYRYPDAFHDQFARQCGIESPTSSLPTRPEPTLLTDFVSHLAKLPGECVFLLRDTYNALDQYQKSTGKGFGMAVNRNYLCRDEQDYFALIQPIYGALTSSSDLQQFLNGYQDRFEHLTQAYPHFEQKAREIFDYVKTHRSEDKITWVDMGFQFTFSIFCYGAMRKYSDSKAPQDFYSLTAYPWISDSFRGRYFSDRNEVVLV